MRGVVAAAGLGDREAMRELYISHARAVHAYVTRIVGEGDAEDVTQQVFAKLLTELVHYRPGNAPFASWVRRVAHNTAIDHVRRRRAVPCEDVEPTGGDSEDYINERSASLRHVLAMLPGDQRDVLLLRHLVGLSPEEVAAHLGRSVRSVHGLSYRGRAAAQAALQEMGFGPATRGHRFRRSAVGAGA
jgi:RNA polymerase sigma-70 factor (ECF subfamily)